MKQILFPLKTDPSTNTDKKWEAMDPLCFAKYISRHLADSQSIQNDTTTVTSSHTTTNVTLAERRGQKPLQINTKFLSQEFTPNIPSSPHPSNAIGSLPPNLASKVMKDIQVSPEPIPLADSHNLRKRPISKLLLPTIVPNDDDLNDDCEGSPSWDPYFLILHNLYDPTAAQLITKELCDLARYFESMPKYTDCISSYKRFQSELFRNSELICNSANNGVQEKIRKFTQLYSEALLHKKALISMAQKLQHETNTTSTITDNDPNHVVSTHEDVPKNNHHGIVVSTQKIYSKKEFTEVMNQWLVDNWTNPYPDDEGIAYLAELNGTTPTIVSNWLINARTRKWRPAIVKAYDARRPADLLKEDSIRIFQRKPLRKLV